MSSPFEVYSGHVLKLLVETRNDLGRHFLREGRNVAEFLSLMLLPQLELQVGLVFRVTDFCRPDQGHALGHDRVYYTDGSNPSLDIEGLQVHSVEESHELSEGLLSLREEEQAIKVDSVLHKEQNFVDAVGSIPVLGSREALYNFDVAHYIAS